MNKPRVYRLTRYSGWRLTAESLEEDSNDPLTHVGQVDLFHFKTLNQPGSVIAQMLQRLHEPQY